MNRIYDSLIGIGKSTINNKKTVGVGSTANSLKSDHRSWLLSLFVLFGMIFNGFTASAQNVAVVGADATTSGLSPFATLSAAFASINGAAQSGAITIFIFGDTSEPATGAVLNAGAWTSISIQPSGVRTITGAATAGLPLIDFNGADNVNVNGFNSGVNSLTISNTTVAATSGTATIRYTGGATNNIITNCNVQGSGTMSVATNGAVIFFSTDGLTANGNDNNTISNCNIGPAGANLPTKGILGNGSTTTTAIGNSGIVITNNNIFDYFGAAVTSAGIATNGGCNTWTITNNRFYQTGTRTWTTGAVHNAINIANTTATSGAQGFTITGNIVGYASNTQTGTYALTGSTGKFIGINFNGITGATVSNVNNNTVANVSVTGVTSSGTSTASPFMGILITNGLVNTNNNIIGSQSATGSLVLSTTTTAATDVYGIYNFSLDVWGCTSNHIGGILFTNAGASGTCILFGMRANTSTTKAWDANSNLVGGTVANSIQLNATGVSSQVIGMQTSNAPAVLTSNTIRNLTTNIGTGTTSSASVIGMNITTSTPNHTVSQNTIFNLSNTNTTANTTVTGIQFTGGTGNVVERNFIYGLTNATTSATGGELNGIRVAGGTTIYRNNMIALGNEVANAFGVAASNSSTSGINGFNGFLGTDSFFHNTVYIGGTPTTGAGPSYAFNGTQTVNTRSFRDNIFVNNRFNSGATGTHYIIKLNGTVPNPTGLTINNNVYFGAGTFGFYNSLDVADIAAWKTVVGQDFASFYSDPQLLDPTNALPDLHLHPSNATVAEGNGADVGVTLDYDGATRSGLTPVDIGADAGNFVGSDLSAPSISYTALLNTASTANRTLSVTITDVTGVNNTAGFRPRVYFNKNAGAYFSTEATLSSGSVTNGVWTCTIDNSLLGGVVATDVVRYFVVAQDVLGNLASNASAGFVGTNVNTVTTPPTTPNSYLISFSYSGTINVGATETFTSLTNAGGIFEAINNGVLTGNVTINITSDLTTELGTNALNQWAEDGAGNYTMLIKPSGAARNITGTNTGALIKINGADRVTINGSTANATVAACLVGGSPSLRELTIQNTNVATTACVLAVQTGTNGAQNNTIKNVNILGQDPTTTLLGISLGGNTPGTAGTDNDNNRIENCSLKKSIFGIYSAGLSAANQNTGTVITSNDLSALTTDRIRRVGIVVFNDDGAQIIYNSVAVETNESNDAVGIGLGNQGIDTTTTTSGNVTNALVSNNKINGIASLSTTGFSAVGISVAGGTTGANTIANNMISGVTAPATSPDIVAGIYVVGATGSNTRLLYNTISLSGDRGAVASQTPSFGIAITGTDPTVRLTNNIISTTQIASGGGNAKSYAVGMVSTAFANLDSNYNAYWSAGANDGGFRTGSLTTAAGTDYATLALYAAAISDDANSLETLPTFTSASDLHLDIPSSAAFNAAATPIAGLTTDFDCVVRDASTPDIGADEFSNSATINLKLFIEGYYDTSIGAMRSVKNNQDGVSPVTDVEEITVELRNSTTPWGIVASTTAVLKTDGTSVCNFNTAPSGSFYIAVRNSNALETWSANPQAVGTTPLTYDFSTAANKAYADNMILVGSVYAFYSGDINQDSVIDGSDATSLDLDIFNSETGVRPTDLNGDGSVDGSDSVPFENNSYNSIFAVFP